jgi:hypothetical protein
MSFVSIVIATLIGSALHGEIKNGCYSSVPSKGSFPWCRGLWGAKYDDEASERRYTQIFVKTSE